jgi:excisionase family DNA binding protein
LADRAKKAPESPKELQRLPEWAQQVSNLRPLPCEFEKDDSHGFAPGHTGTQAIVTIQEVDRGDFHRFTPNAPVFRKSPTRRLPEKLLTLRQVAERLSVCTATVSRLCSRGDLPSVRIANSMRVEPDDLDAFIASRRRKGGGR